ncbi:MAG TPA: diguanylate cyclase [Herbaspirillum sp.]|jgi:diguanylate cyclase (GGDEF)-like protein
MMRKSEQFWNRPTWPVYVLLALVHFASVKLTFFCAVTPENEVVVWLPNAVLLAALLRFRGRRAWLMALVTFSSDVIGNLPVFPWQEAVLLSMVNLTEVAITYGLMWRSGASPDLKRIQDLRKFVAAGPLLGALIAGLIGAYILQIMSPTDTPYFMLARLWWFGDGLGLLIYTPLLLAFTGAPLERIRLGLSDAAIILLTLLLAAVIFTAHGGEINGVSVTPTLLLPTVLFVAFRFGVRWTVLTVAVISLATAFMLTVGHQPFGAVPVHLETVRAQEFILTLCIVGIGFATLFNELVVRERGLEERVSQRTHELELSNSKLAALSATDGLTGIANRRRFDEALDVEWRRAGRSGEPIALAMLDVDLFKQYNDLYGHQAGDDCLRTIAQLFAASARRPGDLAARYGGEEFAFIAPMTDRAHAQYMAESICRSLRQLALPHEMSPFGVVTASIGVAVQIPGENAYASAEMLVQMADAALYQAKQFGRNRVVVADAVTLAAVAEKPVED